MGRLVLGIAVLRCASAAAAFFCGATAFAQSSAPAPAPPAVAPVVPVAPPPPPPTSSGSSESVPPPPAEQPAPATEPPPLDPPAAAEETTAPVFLHREPPAGIERERAKLPSPDFVRDASPWVDFTLTSFYLDERVGNFLNLGVQVGGYVADRFRIAGRIVTPLDDVTDSYGDDYGTFDSSVQRGRRESRQMSVLYSLSAGLVISNNKSFVFGPSLEFLRTDVGAYGSAIALGLPFEWTTQRNLRVGFELALGHAFGGSVRNVCTTISAPAKSCGNNFTDRPGGTSVLFQYYMGWSLGKL